MKYRENFGFSHLESYAWNMEHQDGTLIEYIN